MAVKSHIFNESSILELRTLIWTSVDAPPAADVWRQFFNKFSAKETRNLLNAQMDLSHLQELFPGIQLKGTAAQLAQSLGNVAFLQMLEARKEAVAEIPPTSPKQTGPLFKSTLSTKPVIQPDTPLQEADKPDADDNPKPGNGFKR